VDISPWKYVNCCCFTEFVTRKPCLLGENGTYAIWYMPVRKNKYLKFDVKLFLWNSIPGLGYFLCPALVSCWIIHLLQKSFSFTLISTKEFKFQIHRTSYIWQFLGRCSVYVSHMSKFCYLTRSFRTNEWMKLVKNNLPVSARVRMEGHWKI